MRIQILDRTIPLWHPMMMMVMMAGAQKHETTSIHETPGCHHLNAALAPPSDETHPNAAPGF